MQLEVYWCCRSYYMVSEHLSIKKNRKIKEITHSEYAVLSSTLVYWNERKKKKEEKREGKQRKTIGTKDI